MHPKRGRPFLEKSQPELLATIVDIATHAADDRRRTENLRSVKTLDEMTEAVVSCGYNVANFRYLPTQCSTLFFIRLQ